MAFMAMLPMLASGASSILGGMQQNKTNKANLALQQQDNAARQESERKKQLLSELMLRQQNEGTTLGDGSKSSYKEGLGYVTELSPMAQTISNANQMRQVQEGATNQPMREHEQTTAARRRMDAGADATAQRTQRNAPNTRTIDSILGDLTLKHRNNVNDQFDDVSSNASMQAIRSGSAVNLADLAKGRAEALRSSSPSRTEATNIYNQMNAQSDSNSLNSQGILEQLSRRGESAAVQQSAPSDSVTAALRATSPQTFGVAGALNGVGTSQLSQPNYAMSNVLNSGASAMQGYQDKQAANGQMDQLLAAMSSRGKGNSGYPAQGSGSAF